MSLLEERIKRSSRKPINMAPKQELDTTVVRTPTSPQKEISCISKANISNHFATDDSQDDQDEELEEEDESLPPVMYVTFSLQTLQ